MKINKTTIIQGAMFLVALLLTACGSGEDSAPIAAAKAWGTAVLIDSNTGNATSPQIAINASGNALAVWYQYDGTRWNIWANRFE